MESCFQRVEGGGVIIGCCSIILYLFIGVECSYGVMCSAKKVWRGRGVYGRLVPRWQ